VFRTKLNPNGLVNKLKSRLVVKEYVQVFGVDYSDTFALVARLNTIRLLLALTTQKNWKVCFSWMSNQCSSMDFTRGNFC